MTETVQTTDLRRRVREILDRVRIERTPVIVYTYDTPQAVLIPYGEYEAYRAWQERQQQRQAWLAELRAIAQKVSDRAALSDDGAAGLIDEAFDATRAEAKAA